jgi:(p)ppGpp synthase/HD superfamily hydrolase
MSSIIKNAKDFAYEQHAAVNQRYDGGPYSNHLDAVVLWACYFDHLLSSPQEQAIASAAAYTHDVIEDCRVTYNDVAKATNAEVAEITYLLATPKGRNRAERHCDAYYQEMANNKIATYVKICDRLANVEHSLKQGGSRMLELYRKEYRHFAYFLRNRYPEFAPMWETLDGMLSTETTTPTLSS